MATRKAKTRTKQLEKLGVFEKYNLSETDKQIIQYKLRFADITQTEIALLLGITPSAVQLNLSKPAVKLALKEFEGNWLQKLIHAKEKAANQLIKHITNPNPAISIRACENILQLDKIDTTAHDGEELPPY